MPETVLGVLFKATDKLSGPTAEARGGLGEFGAKADETGEKATGLGVKIKEFISDPLNAVGLASTVAGGALFSLTSSTRDFSQQLERTAILTGQQSEELQAAAMEISNATLATEDVARAFEKMGKVGIKDIEVMKDLTKRADLMADATGIDVVDALEAMIAEAVASGRSLEDAGENLDGLGRVAILGEDALKRFRMVMAESAGTMKEAGVTTDDLAAVFVGLMNKGYDTTQMMTFMRQGVNAMKTASAEGKNGLQALGEASAESSDGFQALGEASAESSDGLQALLKTVGLTGDEFKGLQTEIGAGTELLEKQAAVNTKHLGIMDEMFHKLGDLKLKFGQMLQPLDDVFQGMTALGPALMAVNQAKSMMIPMLPKLAAGLKSIQGVIGIGGLGLIGGVGALAAIGITLWQNWDKVVDFFKQAWEKIKSFFLEGIEKVLGALSTFMRFIPGLGSKVEELRDKISGMIDANEVARQVARAAEAVKKMVEEIAARQEELTEELKAQYEEQRAAELEALDAQRMATLEALDAQLAAALEANDEQLKAELEAIDERRAAAEQAYEENIKRIQDEYGILEEAQKSKLELLREAHEEAESILDEEKNDAWEGYQKKADLADEYYRTEADKLDDFVRLRQEAIEDELDSARLAHNERLAMLDEEYAAKLRTLDEGTQAAIASYQEQIDTLKGQTALEERELEKQRRAERIAALEESIAQEEDSEQRQRFERDLAETLAKYEREDLLESRKAQEQTLRDQIEATRAAARDQEQILKDELEMSKAIEAEALEAFEEGMAGRSADLGLYAERNLARIEAESTAMKEAAEAVYNATLTRIENERVELDAALEENLKRIDDERKAKEDTEAAKLKATQMELEGEELALNNKDAALKEHYAYEKLALEASLADRRAAILAHYAEMLDDYKLMMAAMEQAWIEAGKPEFPHPEIKAVPTESLTPLPGWQHGGIVTRPTLGILGERGPEAVVPLRGIESKNFTSIWNAMKGGLGKLWPLSLSEAGVEIGKGLTAGIVKGVQEGLGSVQRAVSGLEMAGSPRMAMDLPAGGGTSRNVTFNITGDWFVREDKDLNRITKQLNELYKTRGLK